MKTLTQFTAPSTNDILEEIHGIIQPHLLTILEEVYPFRWQPNATTGKTKIAALTSIGGIPIDTPDNDNYYDYVLMTMVKHNGTPEQLAIAESIINTAEDLVWQAINEATYTHFRACYPPRPSTKPGAPESQANWRTSYIYIRAVA